MRTYANMILLPVIIALAACDGVAPTPLPPPVPSPAMTSPNLPLPAAVTVSGLVVELTTEGGRRPVPHLRLRARWGNGDGPAGDIPDVVTDASGRYSIADLGRYSTPAVTVNMLYLATDPAAEYRSLCTAWPVSPGSPPGGLGVAFRDLPVVHKSWSDNKPPRGMWTMYGTTYGVVAERIDGRLEPIEGAKLHGPWMSDETTNAAGFYVSCSPSGWGSTWLTAEKAGYITVVKQISLEMGGSDGNFELTRR